MRDWGTKVLGGEFLTQCFLELQKVAITMIPPRGFEGQLLSLEGMSGAPKQTSAGCGLQLLDTSDATCQRSSVCGTPETPKERVP